MRQSALAVPLDRHRPAEEVEGDRHRPVVGRRGGETAQRRDHLAQPGIERRVAAPVGQVGGVDDRPGPRQLAEFARLLRREARLVRSATPDDMDVAHSAGTQRAARMGGEVGVRQLGGRLGEEPGAVDRDVAVADHRDARMRERHVEPGEFGMPVVPADERRRAEDAGQVLAGDTEPPVVRRAGCQHNRVVKAEQLVEPDAAPPHHVTSPTNRTPPASTA